MRYTGIHWETCSSCFAMDDLGSYRDLGSEGHKLRTRPTKPGSSVLRSLKPGAQFKFVYP